MAASSLCRDFRKINIEQYEDDFYEDEAAQAEPLHPQMNEVQMLISSGKGQDALKAALKDCASSNNQSVKDAAAEVVIRALTSHKPSQIDATIGALSEEEVDVAMKYVYKAFSMNKDGHTCASLLQWHSKLTQKGGMGSIVRVLADRHRL